jgi:hypothetical protein
MAAKLLISGGFHVIGNLIEVRVPLPILIAADLKIEWPDDSQIEIIHDLLEHAAPMHNVREQFEYEFQGVPVAAGISWTRTPLRCIRAAIGVCANAAWFNKCRPALQRH